MQTNADPVYLDSSAVVKLVVRERETDALVRFLAERPRRVSSALVRVEVLRAVRTHGPELVDDARDVLQDIQQMRVSNALLDLAADVDPRILRSLDAIHLAAVWRLAPAIEMVTYDHRLRDAAQAIGLAVASPGV